MRKQAEQIIPFNQGGTGQSTYNKGDMLVAVGTNDLEPLPVGTESQSLRVKDGVPSWQTSGELPPVSTSANGDLLYYLNGWTGLRASLNDYILRVNSGLPQWFNLFGTSNTFTAQQNFSGANGINIGGWTLKLDGSDLVVYDKNGQEQGRWISS
jgi:hypothetical protein